MRTGLPSVAVVFRARTPPLADSPSDYARVYEVDVTDLNSLVAVPHDLSDVRNAGDVSGVRIDEAIVGTCTGGRLEDLRVVAAILDGRRIAGHTRMLVNPGSRAIYAQAIREGLISTLIEAGATIGVTGCGPCSGCHQGMLAPAETAITTSSRNFRGRSGSPESMLYVASPATVAASAVAGSIVPPADVMRR